MKMARNPYFPSDEHSISSDQSTDYLEELEVTREDYVQQFNSQGSTPPSAKQRLSSIMPRRRNKTQRQVMNDNATTYSGGGIMSVVSSFTRSSHDTVKISNRSSSTLPKKNPEHQNKPKHPWYKLKRIIGVQKTAPDVVDAKSTDRKRRPSMERHSNYAKAQSSQEKSPPRSRSAPSTVSSIAQEIEDTSIRGRLDGFDILSLSACLVPLVTSTDNADKPWSDLTSFTGQDNQMDPKHLVQFMLMSGKDSSELILDGFFPGSDDRWVVKIICSEPDGHVDSKQPTAQQIWERLWGPGPIPIESAYIDKVSAEQTDDSLLQLAAERSIPIDLDEDTFIISNREHMSAIQDIASTALSQGRLHVALQILGKVLKGIELSQDQDIKFLRGTTMHNMGMVQLWQGQYGMAVDSFARAANERRKYLPDKHPDIAVSIFRKGIALFALSKFPEAMAAFEETSALLEEKSATLAKVLTCMGVIRCKEKSFVAALKDFTSALEIQREWLESSVRREWIIHDSAVTLNNMGILYMQRGHCDLAYFVYEEALLLLTSLYPKDHPLVVAALTNMAVAKAHCNEIDKALKILHGCLRSQNARYGDDSTTAIETLGLVSLLYAQKGNYEEALKYLLTVKKWQKQHLPSHHTAYIKIKASVAWMEDKIGKSGLSLWFV